ncbi:MAG: hypothetical protein JWQ07_4036 [Ramlibacter sp.]|nr:hypothetical protein [Ramlibacter sp.]
MRQASLPLILNGVRGPAPFIAQTRSVWGARPKCAAASAVLQVARRSSSSECGG